MKWISWYADIRMVNGEVIPYFLWGMQYDGTEPDQIMDVLADQAQGEIWGMWDEMEFHAHDGESEEVARKRIESINSARKEDEINPYITTSIDGSYVQIARRHIVSVRYRSEVKDQP